LHRIDTPELKVYRPRPAILCPTNGDTEEIDCTSENIMGNYTIWQCFWMETLATCVYIIFVCNIKFLNGAKDDMTNALGACMVLYGMINMMGHVTGGCLSPAIGLV